MSKKWRNTSELTISINKNEFFCLPDEKVKLKITSDNNEKIVLRLYHSEDIYVSAKKIIIENKTALVELIPRLPGLFKIQAKTSGSKDQSIVFNIGDQMTVYDGKKIQIAVINCKW